MQPQRRPALEVPTGPAGKNAKLPCPCRSSLRLFQMANKALADWKQQQPRKRPRIEQRVFSQPSITVNRPNFHWSGNFAFTF
jgi:hypothetical protein